MKKVRLMMKMVGLFVGPAIIAVALTIWREAAEKRLSPQ
jgi:predicted PurR-regulated permease PerM